MPARRSWMKPSEDVMRAAARGNCEPLVGVGSSLYNEKDELDFGPINLRDDGTYSNTKNGLSARTTGSLCDR